MSDKKRKAGSQDDGRPSKKVQNGMTVKVQYVNGPDTARPVVATLPSVTLPNSIKFNPYSKTTNTGSELLLQSSDHVTIDYTAVETTTTNSTEKHFKHYVAVFDPATATLQVTEAKKLNVRSCVRQAKPTENSEEGEDIQPVTNYSSRAALTQAFGTKKSKRAVQSIAENRLLAHGGDDADNPLTKAILSTKDDDEEDMASILNDPMSDRANKPLPKANTHTGNIKEVYSLESLVLSYPAKLVLDEMPISKWLGRISNQQAITTHYRYIANRVEYLGKAHRDSPGDETLKRHVQTLRYIQLLLEINKYISQLPKFRPIPPPSKWPENTITGNIAVPILSKISKHYFPTGKPLSNSLVLLRTTIMALTLHIPPPSLNLGSEILVTEPSDIALDMAMSVTDINRHFRELGCKIESATELQLGQWGLTKLVNRVVLGPDGEEKKMPKPKFAKLVLPLVFPKISQGRNVGRR